MLYLNKEQLGQFYAVLAFLFWGGLSPIYFKEVASVNSFEVLVYRVIFSVIFLIPLIFYKKETQKLFFVLKDKRKIYYLFISTFFISLNWLVFIWAIANEKILETALGYYINPLVNVLLGFLVFNEKMDKNQYIAIILALLAVLYQFISLGYIPVVSLVLAVSFGIYGMLRKKIEVGSIVGLFVEVLLLLPFAFIYLFYNYFNGGIAFIQNSDSYTSFMLTLAGLITIIPLLLFNGAATRMKLTTLGFFQYIGPTVAFLLAVFVYKEEFNIDKLITFTLIWIALIFFSYNSIKKVLINR